MRYAIFLRGVNVAGIKVPSADLKRVLSDLGLTDVKTYVASGNVTGVSEEKAAALQMKVEAALSTAFSYDAHVQVFSHDQLASIVTGYPFETDDDHHRYVVFSDSGRTEILAELRPMFEGLVAADSRLTDEDRQVVDAYLRDIIAAMRTVM